MTARAPIPTLAALGLGALGAGLASAAHLPAGALVGAALATAAAASAGARLHLPARLRDLGFAAIGLTLGAGIHPGFLSDLWRWAPSLILLLVAQVATILSGARLLSRRAGLDRETALLSASPGGISTAIALALEGRGEAAPVLVLQVMRIFVLVTLTPPLAFLLSPPVAAAAGPPMGWAAFLVLIAMAYPLGRWGGRRGMPAATLLIAMVLSGTAHGLGLIDGRPPPAMVFASFALAGIGLGSRLTGLGLADIARLGRATALLLTNAVAISLVFAMAAAWLTGLDPGASWIAFAPGGVEAMAAIGLALGYDPAFIAIHHVSRIVFLTLFVPILIARSRRIRAAQAP